MQRRVRTNSHHSFGVSRKRNKCQIRIIRRNLGRQRLKKSKYLFCHFFRHFCCHFFVISVLSVILFAMFLSFILSCQFCLSFCLSFFVISILSAILFVIFCRFFCHLSFGLSFCLSFFVIFSSFNFWNAVFACHFSVIFPSIFDISKFLTKLHQNGKK